jgi:hypothetical protein
MFCRKRANVWKSENGRFVNFATQPVFGIRIKVQLFELRQWFHSRHCTK